MLSDAPIVPYIPVADMGRARKFYEGILGLKPREEYAGGVIYECGKGSWVFMYRSAGAGTSKASTAFWAVDDVAAEVVPGAHSAERSDPPDSFRLGVPHTALGMRVDRRADVGRARSLRAVHRISANAASTWSGSIVSRHRPPTGHDLGVHRKPRRLTHAL